MKQEMARSRWSWLTALTLGAGGITTSVEADCDLDKIHQFVPIFRSTSVSADGDYAAVGVPWLLAKQGAVFVLRRDGESWVKEDELRRPGNFGWSVSLSGDRLAVTSAGPPQSAPVYIFRRKGTEWVEEDEIQGGRLVALHRDRLLTGSGPVSVFRREGTSWTLEQELLSLGGDPALDDNVVVSGDPARGRVNVFRRISDEIGSRWYPEGPLSAGDSCPDFGSVVSVSGDVLVVGGAPNYNGTNCGRAYVFRYDGEEWLEEQQLVGVDVETSDQFGASVAVRGDLALVGAHAEPCCDYRGDGFGYVSVFRYDGAEWREESTLAPPDATTDDKFGWKVALSGGTAYLPAATEVYACDVAASEPVGPTFLRGDCDADGSVNITDGVVLLGSLFLGEGAPSCLSACDFNRSGSLDITTSVYLFQHLFVGGPALPAPSAECGPISELDGVLGCEASQTSCR